MWELATARAVRSGPWAILVLAVALCGPLLAAPGAEAAPCAQGSLSGSFSSPPQDGAISTDDEVDCFGLPGAASGDRLAVRFDTSSVSGGSPRWRLDDGGGNTICSSSSGAACTVDGLGPWSIEVYDGSASAGVNTFAYSIAAQRLNEPQGCAPLGAPDSWSFASPRIDGSFDSPLDARCYTFTRAVGEADGRYWFRSIRLAGSTSPGWTVYGPSGDAQCSGSYDGVDTRCQALAFGQFALVVDGNGSAGSYALTARKLTNPGGCSSSPAVVIGSAPTAGTIASAGETDCYSLSGLSPGDAVAIAYDSPTGSNYSPRVSVIDGAGDPVCDSTYGWSSLASCQLDGTPGWAMIVYDRFGTGTFSYSAAVRRLTDPEGCTALDQPAVWSFASPRINGSLAGTLDARCYTFTRAVGEEDGAYWFRSGRTAGTVSPNWTVVGPSGNRECSGGEGFQESSCRLLGSGQYMVLVTDQNDNGNAGSYYLSARRLTNPSGCGPLPSIAFGAAPATGDLSTGGNIDCYGIPDVASGDSVLVDFLASAGANPRWAVVDAQGYTVCDSSYYYYSSCSLAGGGGWAVLVYDYGSGSYSYSLAARRLTNPQGCASLGDPAVWSFTAPRLNGSIESALASRCSTFTRSIDDPDGRYWFRSIRTSGALSPAWNVYGPNGQKECSGSSSDPQSSCLLLAAGQFAFVVGDSGKSQTGSYFATPKRLTAPTGCTELSSIAFGLPPVNGKLSAGGEVDCYRLNTSAQDILKFTSTGSANSFALIDAEGTVHCQYFSQNCTIPEDDEMTLLFYSSNATSTGNYRFEASCENVPCGQSDTAVVDAIPNRLGQGEFTTTLLRGHDLDLLESVALVRGSQTLAATIEDPAPDGRAAELRFDLSDAAPGAWELRATFIDGTTRALPDAVTVEAVRPARMSLETVGRDVFRPGTANTVTLEVTNQGNVDGLGVPVVLGGLPESSQIEPAFELQEPVGNPGSAHLEESAYDQEDDTVVDEEGVSLPLLLSRVPAGRTIRLEYRITVPTLTTYELRASVGICLTNDSTAASALAVTQADGDPAVNCVARITEESIKQEAGDVIRPNKVCMDFVGDAATDVFADAAGGDSVTKPTGLISWAIGGSACAVEFVPLVKLPKIAYRASKFLSGVNWLSNRYEDVQDIGDCLAAGDRSELNQRGVTAIDPNEIRGPAGSGEQRFIPGDGPLGYQVLFENLPAATAPAQRVEISNQLDPARFDVHSVRFHQISFGSTSYTLPYEESEIDAMIDLRPAQELLVHATAAASESGEIEVVLQAIDPETGEPPEDPTAGFLPPNVTSPEGEGHIGYTVHAKSLPSGSVLSNQAAIRFDQNEPIVTPVWTNKIDKLPPTASVTATIDADPASASVAWSGSDDAAGIAQYEVRVSRDGGPFVLWRTADAAGSGTFSAEQSGSYSFRVVAHDGANNLGQSNQVAVGLQVEDEQGPSPSSPAGSSSAAAPPPASGLDDRAPVARIGRLKVSQAKRTLTASFSAVDPGEASLPMRYRCSLDRRAFAPCSSPKTYKRLPSGRHRFRVVAIDAVGNSSPPSTKTFAIAATHRP